MKGDAFYTKLRKREAVNAADASGQVADSMEVRMALMERVRKGEITLEAAQAELKKIKRGAKAAGKTTRAGAWRNG